MTTAQKSKINLKTNVNSNNNSNNNLITVHSHKSSVILNRQINNNNNKRSTTNMNTATAAATTAGSILSYVTGGGGSNKVANNNNSNNNSNANHNQDQNRIELENAWTLAGRQFSSSKEMYTRSLYRLCLKFTTSEDEDEGKSEPATAFWTVYGMPCTIGNAGPTDAHPDSICRRMDDSMSGPASGILSRITDQHGMSAVEYAMRSGAATGWHIRGDRGDTAVRVGKAKVFTSKQPDAAGRDAQILSLDADRWVLCKGASFAAGNSVFSVEDHNEAKAKLVVHCSKGPMRGKVIDIYASRCPYVFGRAHEADLCVMDRELSRRHGAILYLPRKGNPTNRGGSTTATTTNPTSGNFVLVDLESTVRQISPHYFHHTIISLMPFVSNILPTHAFLFQCRTAPTCEWWVPTVTWARAHFQLETNL
jgi:hypothetical protein